MLKKLVGKISPNIIILFIAFGLLLAYYITSQGRTPYDYFTRLSDSFLQGKYYLTENPSWLSELIPAGVNKYYVVYPPMPAILAMPFRLIFGEKFEQQYLAHLLGVGITIATMLSAWKIKKDKKLLIWVGLLAGFGNIIWFLAASGSSWYLGQVTSAFFISFALFEAITRKRSFLVGLLFGAAFLSRINICVSIPVFLYLLHGKEWFKNYIKLGLGILPFILFNFAYNYIRFGVIWDQAYFILPKILNELDKPWFIKGVTNIAYIPNNLIAAFWSFPKIISTPPYIIPSWSSLAIWITTPAFIFAFLSPIREKLTRYLWISILLTFLVVSMHGGTGWAQFGYRFAVDFYPFLFILTIKGVAKTGLKWQHWFLLILSIIVNFWGVIWINKFGWVSF
jgi:hypothetical protein